MTNDKKENLINIGTGFNNQMRKATAKKVHYIYSILTVVFFTSTLILATIVMTNDSKSELERTRKLLDTCNTYNLNPNFIKPEGAI
jgi:hypothetical protein